MQLKHTFSKHWKFGWLLAVLRFNDTLTGKVMAVGDAHAFPGFPTPVKSHQLLFSHVSPEVRSQNTPERNFVSTGSWTHNHQVLSPAQSPLSHPGRASWKIGNYCEDDNLLLNSLSKWNDFQNQARSKQKIERPGNFWPTGSFKICFSGGN